MMLVSLSEAKEHLRVDYDAEDLLITTYVHAASHAVLNYLKDAADAFLDSNGEVVEQSPGEPVGVPFVVKASVLLLTHQFYTERGGGVFQQGYLPEPITALLYPLRDPALA